MISTFGIFVISCSYISFLSRVRKFSPYTNRHNYIIKIGRIYLFVLVRIVVYFSCKAPLWSTLMIPYLYCN